jgi:hypothetical protein
VLVHVQRLISIVKMATVLEEYLPKSSVLLCVLCRQNESMQGIFIKKCFLFSVGSVCHLKRCITGLRNVANVLLMMKMLKRGVEVAETTVKRLICCRF